MTWPTVELPAEGRVDLSRRKHHAEPLPFFIHSVSSKQSKFAKNNKTTQEMKRKKRNQSTGESATGMIKYWLDCAQEKNKLENFTEN